jgi:release factor H-coupled RctB family protein
VSQQIAEVRVIASTKNWIEGAAVQQLERTASLPGIRLAVGLPDLHPGKGSPIGAAFIAESWIYPALVGNDIGCGIGLWRTSLGTKRVKQDARADRLRNLDHEWDGNSAEFLGSRGIPPSGYEHSLGTIGSGNHFAEIQIVESIANGSECESIGIAADSVCLCVHSGSRGFGEAILRDHVARFASDGLRAETDDARKYLVRHNHAKLWASAKPRIDRASNSRPARNPGSSDDRRVSQLGRAGWKRMATP